MLVFNNQFFDFLGITVSENYTLNQIKADLGGLWLIVGVAPLLWLRTKDNFWIRILFVTLGFVMIARVISFAQEGIHDSSIYDGALLEPGMEFTGPAIIEDSGSTTVVHPGNYVHIDSYGNVHINLREN